MKRFILAALVGVLEHKRQTSVRRPLFEGGKVVVGQNT